MLLHTLLVHHTPFQRNVIHVMLYTLRVNVKIISHVHTAMYYSTYVVNT